MSASFTQANGTVIDGDLGTAGVQSATVGTTAFTTIAQAVAAANTAGNTNAVFIVNAGTYNESLSLTGTEQLAITGTGLGRQSHSKT